MVTDELLKAVGKGSALRAAQGLYEHCRSVRKAERGSPQEGAEY